MKHLTKIDGWWRGPEKEWQKEIYGFYPRGLGDLIAINCRKIMEDGKGLDFLLECVILLSERERWPLELEDGIQQYIAKNRIQWRWSQLLRRLKIRKTELYRSRNSITIDPYIYYMSACVKLGKSFAYPTPPWYLTWRRPEFRHWRRALVGKWNMYKFWRWVNEEIRIVPLLFWMIFMVPFVTTFKLIFGIPATLFLIWYAYEVIFPPKGFVIKLRKLMWDAYVQRSGG